MPPTRSLLVAATLAMAGGVHLSIGLDHGTSWHGALFVAAGAAQVALAMLAGLGKVHRRFHAAIGLNGLVVAAWVASRLPLVGGGEPLGAIDLVTAGLELTTIAFALAALRSDPRRRNDGRRFGSIALTGAVAVVVMFLVPSAHGDHGHDDDHDQRAVARPPIFGDLFAEHGAGHD